LYAMPTPSSVRRLLPSRAAYFLIPAVLLLVTFPGNECAWGWGGTGHRIINGNAVTHLPPALLELAVRRQFLEDHAGDADYRKSTDIAEYPKHFLDLESYPDYPHLTPGLAALVTQYGWSTVRANGILRSRELVDSILLADNAARSASEWNGSQPVPGTYYTVLWERTQRFTIALLRESTTDIASLWYTAWMNAGVTTQVETGGPVLAAGPCVLEQNFPNPFNPSTSIRYTLPRDARVDLEVFNILGERVSRLVQEEQTRGGHQITFDARGLPSGIYFCRLRTTEGVLTRRMMLAR
jgi:hypothetical protein